MKKKFYTFRVLLAFGCFLFLLNTAEAIDLSFQPRLETGVVQYSFESEALGNTTPSDPPPNKLGSNYTQQSFEYSDTLYFIGAGGTFFLNRLFMDVSGQYAFDGRDEATVPFSGYSSSQNSYVAAVPRHRASFDRDDIAVSLGYAINRRLSVFAGYKWARTEFKTTYQGRFSLVNHDAVDGVGGSAGGRISGDFRYNFNYEGPFIGAIQGWDFSQVRFLKGVLTATVALAYLEGEVALRQRSTTLTGNWLDGREVPEVSVSEEDGVFSNRIDTEGDTLGLTLGVGWRGVTAVEGLTYFFGISGYRYEFEAERNDQSDINETVVTYKLGLSYVF